MALICGSCDKKNSDDNRFCSYCGKSLEVKKKKESSKKENKNIAPMIISVFIAALLLGYGGVWVYHPYVETIRADAVADKVELTNQMNTDKSLLNNKISDLESQIVDNNNDFNNKISKLSLNNTQLLLDKQSLEDKVSNLESKVSTLEFSKNLLESSNEDLENEKKNLLSDKETLEDKIDSRDSQISALKVKKIKAENLAVEYYDLADEYYNLADKYYDEYLTYFNLYYDLKDDYDKIDSKVKSYDTRYSLSPQLRDEYFPIGYGEKGATYAVTDYDYAWFTFPNVKDCIVVGRAADTGSMRPMVHTDHRLIFTKCFEQSDINIGDIISFKANAADRGISCEVYTCDSAGQISIFHQVTEILDDGVITQGICPACTKSDGLILWEDITKILIAIIY